MNLTLTHEQARALLQLFNGMDQGMATPRETVATLAPVHAQLIESLAPPAPVVSPAPTKVFAPVPRSEAETPEPKVITPHVEHAPVVEHKRPRHR